MSAIPLARPASPWQRALPSLALLLIAIVALYRDTALGMVSIWMRSDTFMHAFLVLPISLWLIWQRREELARQVPTPAPWWLLPIGVGAAVWLLGDLVVANSVTQLAFVGLLVAAVPAVLGTQVARTIAFPLGFLFFMVPIGEFVMPWFIAWTADFTVFALKLSGIPVYREGMQFVIPTGMWSVVEACSGVRYLIASVMVGVLFAYLNYHSLRRRLIFVGVSFLVPIVANWVRAYLIVMLGHVSGNTLAVGADHLIYGWVFFGVVITLMFLIGSRWSEPPLPLAAKPAGWQLSAASTASVGAFVLTAAVAGVLTAIPHQVLHAVVALEKPGAPQLSQPESWVGGWQAAGRFTDWTPRFVGPAAELDRSYAASGPAVGLHIAYYRHQGADRKLVSSENVLVLESKDKVWNRVGSEVRGVEVAGRSIEIRATRLRGHATATRPQEQRLVAWQLYWVAGRLTTNDHVAKLLGAWQRLLGGGDDGALVVVYTPDDGSGKADAALQAFLRDNLDRIEAQLAKARDGG